MDEFLAGMTAAQYEKWKAYYRKWPSGGYWDWHKAMVPAWVALNNNPFRSKESKGVPLAALIPGPEQAKWLKRQEADKAPSVPTLAVQTGANVIDLSQPIPLPEDWQ